MPFTITDTLIKNIISFSNKSERMTQLFLNNIQKHCTTLEEGIEKLDYPIIQKSAHQLKGNCAIRGLDKSHSFAKEIESQAKAKENLSTIKESYQNFLKTIIAFEEPQK